MKRFFSTAAVALTFMCSSALANGPYGQIQIGNWKGGAYTNDQNGQFTHCAAGSQYVSGIYFMVSVNINMDWMLGFAHKEWQLKVGELIPLELTFDGRTPVHVYGNAVSTVLVVVQMPPNSQLVQQFRGATQMAAVAKGQLFKFNLNATSHLLPALTNCVNQAKSGVALSSIVIRNALAAPAAPQRPAVPPVSTLKPTEASAPPAPDLQIEAIELASNFVINGRLPNAHILSRSETPAEFASFGAAWKADGARGSVRVLATPGDVKGIDVAAAIAAGDSKECKGKFASGRVSELLDSDVIFRGFAHCEDSSGVRTVQYFILPRRKGGFVIFSVAGDQTFGLSNGSGGANREDKIVDLQKAALLTVSQ